MELLIMFYFETKSCSSDNTIQSYSVKIIESDTIFNFILKIHLYADVKKYGRYILLSENRYEKIQKYFLYL